MLFFADHASAADPIRMGYFNLAPHHYCDSNDSEPTGAGIKYFEILASNTDDTVEWVGPIPLLRLFKKIELGEIDGTIGLPKFPKLIRVLDYTTIPMFFAKPILVILKNNPLQTITSANDIEGWRIGIISSITGIYTPFIDNNRDMFTLDAICGNKWVELNIKKLLGGRIETIFDRNQFTLPFVTAKMKVYSQIKVLFVPDPPTPMYVCFSKVSKRGQILIKKINAALSSLNLNYEQMAQQEIDTVVHQHKWKTNRH
jgi:hypothetical protein